MIKNFVDWIRQLVIAHRRYAYIHKRRLHLFAPRGFTEKIQWRKLFDDNPAFAVFCDKLAVRGVIAARVGERFLVPLLWSGDADHIDFDAPAPYVLKSSHASGHIWKYESGTLDRPAIRAMAQTWLAEPYGRLQQEPGYLTVPPQLMIERMLKDGEGAPPEERRLFVFGGKVRVINTVLVEEGRVRNGAFHTPDWTRLNWHFNRFMDRAFPKPLQLAEMIRAAEAVAAGLDHARVDFYDCGTSVFIGEVTLYSWSGLSAFRPDEADFTLGAYWELAHPAKRAWARMRAGRWGNPRGI